MRLLKLQGSALVWAVLLMLFAIPLTIQQAWADDGLTPGAATGLQASETVLASGKAGTCPWSLDSGGTLTILPGDYSTIDTGGYKNAVKRVVFKADGDAKVVLKSRLDHFDQWEYYWAPRLGLDQFPNMVEVDLSGLDTSGTFDLRSMFAGCSSLTSIDLSPLDTSNVRDMNNMFDGCSSLTSINLSSLDLSKAYTMKSLFKNCSSLTSIDLSSLGTARMNSMLSMFEGCSSLTSIDLSPLDTSRVSSMERAFSGCSSLESLDLSVLDVSHVLSMREMFLDCLSLKTLELSGLETPRLQDTHGMFHCCFSLTTLDLSSFDTSNVWNMGYMFRCCRSLISLDLSGFSMSRVTNSEVMFDRCPSLMTIVLSESAMEIRLTGRDGLASLPGAWRGPTGDVFSGDEFKTKFVPALMHGTWKRVFDLSRCTLNFTNSAYSKEEGVRYTGKPFEPVVRVSDGGGCRLVEGTDYTVSYENNIDAGTATVVVTGIGKASGTNTLTFKIAPAPISIPKAKTGLVYNGKKLTGVKAGSGFSATNNTARAAGSYTATLIADRNHVFTGGKSTVKVKWSIAKASQEVSAKNCSSSVKVKKSSKVKALGKNVTVLFKKKAGVSAKTTVRYVKSNAAGGKKIVVNKKTGKVTLKKGLKAGTYKVKIKLSALAGKNYKPASKLVTLKVTIR